MLRETVALHLPLPQVQHESGANKKAPFKNMYADCSFCPTIEAIEARIQGPKISPILI